MSEYHQVLWRAILGFPRGAQPSKDQIRAAARDCMLRRLGFSAKAQPTLRSIKRACEVKHLRRSRSVGPASALVWALQEAEGWEAKRQRRTA